MINQLLSAGRGYARIVALLRELEGAEGFLIMVDLGRDIGIISDSAGTLSVGGGME